MKKLSGKNNRLAVNIAAVGDVQNFYEFLPVVNIINNAVIAAAQAVISAITQFFTAERPGVIFQIKDFMADSVLKVRRQFFELMFGARDDFNRIVHQACFSSRSPVKNFLKGREDWWLRVSAMAKSIMSSLRRALWIKPARMAFCSSLVNALNAVRNTCALAWMAVIIKSPLRTNLTQEIGNVKVYGWRVYGLAGERVCELAGLRVGE